MVLRESSAWGSLQNCHHHDATVLLSPNTINWGKLSNSVHRKSYTGSVCLRSPTYFTMPFSRPLLPCYWAFLPLPLSDCWFRRIFAVRFAPSFHHSSFSKIPSWKRFCGYCLLLAWLSFAVKKGFRILSSLYSLSLIFCFQNDFQRLFPKFLRCSDLSMQRCHSITDHVKVLSRWQGFRNAIKPVQVENNWR